MLKAAGLPKRHLARPPRQLNSRVLSIVNVVDSSISRESDWSLLTNAGPEIGVASTKAFITQVVALTMLAIGTSRLPWP